MKIIQKFSELQLSEPLLQALNEVGYDTPTPIQAQAIPALLEGKDLIGQAQTGTGKTAAFALPILERLYTNPAKVKSRHTRCLVLTPTRELAIQILQSFKAYGKYTKLKHTVVYGGVGQMPQVKTLSAGVDILVATPGRLLDLYRQSHLSLDSVEVFVLDEADRMLDMGFINDIREVIKLLPKKRHNLFFSATMSRSILQLSNTMLVDPVRVEVTPAVTTAEKIDQSVIFIENNYKRELLKQLLDDPAYKKVIVFTRTKHGANRVSETLNKQGISSSAIHGNKSQLARQTALENFKAGKTRVLVATDLAARGIDIDDVSHVINFELPNVAESYVHRIGRTARAGASGKAVSFCDREERAYLKDIERLIKQTIPVIEDHPFKDAAGKTANAVASFKEEDTRPPRRERPSSGSSRGGTSRSDSRSPSRGGSSRPDSRGGRPTDNKRPRFTDSRGPRKPEGRSQSAPRPAAAAAPKASAEAAPSASAETAPKREFRPNKRRFDSRATEKFRKK